MWYFNYLTKQCDKCTQGQCIAAPWVKHHRNRFCEHCELPQHGVRLVQNWHMIIYVPLLNSSYPYFKMLEKKFSKH